MADFFDDIQQDINNKVKEQYDNLDSNEFEFDPLKLYFGYDYEVNDYIKVKQPTLGEVIEFGENKMFASIGPFIGNATSYRVQLWDIGVDWNKVTDYEVFLIMYRTLIPEYTSLIFGDFDFTQLVPLENKETGAVSLFILEKDENGEIIDAHEVINELSYTLLCNYLRTMFNQHPKNQFAKGKSTKKMIIEKERRESMEKAIKNNKKNSSYLLSLISACLNHPGFKYKKNELKEVGYVEFMDSVQRLQIYEQTTAFLKGMYSGMMDTSKMSKEQVYDSTNWMKDLYS